MSYYSNLFLDLDVPKALTQEEMANYFARYKNGDLKAREALINGNIRLVFNLVLKTYFNIPYDKDELVAIGLIGLIKAVDSFDISRNLRFSTYASICINNEIKMFMRKGKKYSNDISLDSPFRIDECDNLVTLRDILCDEGNDLVDDYEQKEIFFMVRNLVFELCGRERDIMILYFGLIDGKPLSQVEIGRELNISQSYVSRIIKSGLQKIIIKLKKMGLVEEEKSLSKVLRKE